MRVIDYFLAERRSKMASWRGDAIQSALKFSTPKPLEPLVHPLIGKGREYFDSSYKYTSPTLNDRIDDVQMNLDAVGLGDPTGISDGVNAGIYGARGYLDPANSKSHYTNAGISVAGMVPFAGAAPVIGKYVNKGVNAARNAKAIPAAVNAKNVRRAVNTGQLAARGAVAFNDSRDSATKPGGASSGWNQAINYRYGGATAPKPLAPTPAATSAATAPKPPAVASPKPVQPPAVASRQPRSANIVRTA